MCICQVSALKCGLMPLCAETMAIDEVSYYDYVGAIVDAERRDRLRRALGPANKARTHSTLVDICSSHSSDVHVLFTVFICCEILHY